MANRVWLVFFAMFLYHFEHFRLLFFPVLFIRYFIKNLRILVKFEIGLCSIICVLFFDLYSLESVYFHKV